MRRSALLAPIFLLVLAACGGAKDPRSVATAVTRAVYGNNPAAAAGYFDDALRPQITRASVGLISDKMHALGRFSGLTLLSSDTSRHEYIYRAAFERGTMNVVVRVDSDGRLAAYRVFPT